jgi:signal transduction histidine kinase
VAQQSGATVCTVSLSAAVATLQLVIEDNGRGIGGITPTQSVRRGLGLIGIRERAQILDGSFHIENRMGGGTRIVVTLPSQPVPDPVAEQEPRRAG